MSRFPIICLFYLLLLTASISAVSTLLNATFFWLNSAQYINIYLFLIIFGLSLFRALWGLSALIFLLPLSLGLAVQLNAYLGTNLLVLPNTGLDITSGFLFGCFVRYEIAKFKGLQSSFPVKNIKCKVQEFFSALPFMIPVLLLNFAITISTIISISRNLYQSASSTSIRGILFNLIYFRPIGWRDDFMPIGDWIAYSLGCILIIMAANLLRFVPDKNKIVFTPIIAGLIIAGIVGVIQSFTGLGLPLGSIEFRKDLIGYAAIGLQSDIHSYAGHMILGCLGLFGYRLVEKKPKIKLIDLTILLCFCALILSKSRSTLIFAVFGFFLLWLIYLKKSRPKLLLPVSMGMLTSLILIGYIALHYADNLRGVPVLTWMGDLLLELRERDFKSLNSLGGVFGSRFEIWEGALRMWSNFPIFGIGQGDFYRLSSIASFSKSHFLILNNGENAHNFFLQTLTENGLIGFSIFSALLLHPFFISNNRNKLVPALIALISLCLGNIFSHSFLLRENLFLAMILISLLYASSISDSDQIHLAFNSSKNYSYLRNRYTQLAIYSIFILGLLEVFFSYNKMPFEFGRFCFSESSMPIEDWSTGKFSFAVPDESSGLDLSLTAPKTRGVVIGTVDWLTNDRMKSVSLGSFELNGGERKTIHMDLLWPTPNAVQGGQIVVSLSKCFVPRNQGLNIDSRRLGVYVNEISFTKSSDALVVH